MVTLCDRCIRGIRSRGETLYISEIAEKDNCFWCENADDELFKVAFNRDYYGDGKEVNRSRKQQKNNT